MKKQKGFSTVGWMFIIGMAGFLMMLVIAVVPPFIDNMYVEDALKSLAEEGKLSEMSKGEVKGHISRYLSINNINTAAQNSFEVKKYGQRVIVNSVYEVRSNFFANVDVVVKFENQLDSNNPSACCEYLVTKLDD